MVEDYTPKLGETNYYFPKYLKLRRYFLVWIIFTLVVLASISVWGFYYYFLKPSDIALACIIHFIFVVSILIFGGMLYPEFEGQEIVNYHVYPGDGSVFVLAEDTSGANKVFEGTVAEFKRKEMDSYYKQLDSIIHKYGANLPKGKTTYLGLDNSFKEKLEEYDGFRNYVTSSGKLVTVPHGLQAVTEDDFYVYIEDADTGYYNYYMLPESGNMEHLGMVKVPPTIRKSV